MFDGSWSLLPAASAIHHGQGNAFGTDIFGATYINGFEDPLPTDSEATSSESPTWHSTATTPSKAEALPTPERRLSSVTSEAALDLPRLHQGFASHLAQLRATPWDILGTLRLDTAACCSGCQCRPSTADHTRAAAFDPLPSTFRLVAEFEQILQDMRTPEVAAAAATDYAPQIKFSYALTAMSCYIQLVLVYDFILSHLAEQCANNRVVRDFVLRCAPPPMMLSGQYVLLPARNFLGKALIRLLEQRVGTIEDVLGLPDEFCVSRRKRRKDNRSKTEVSNGHSGSNSDGNSSSSVCSVGGINPRRHLDDDDRSLVDISDSWGGETGLIGDSLGKSLLGVLQASLLTKGSDTERPAVMENLRAQMTYLEQLA
ncbi:hypothetical protein MN608_10785 [Microdochium nivale]|nr:hypothetical protein MN608_10785 [Microdochium nivale]